jgi:hypothetical protein
MSDPVRPSPFDSPHRVSARSSSPNEYVHPPSAELLSFVERDRLSKRVKRRAADAWTAQPVHEIAGDTDAATIAGDCLDESDAIEAS